MKATITRERLLRFKMAYIDDEEVEAIEKELSEIEEKSSKYDVKETALETTSDRYGDEYCASCGALVENENGHVFNYCPDCGIKVKSKY